MIKSVIFDLDGVLVDTKDLHYRALNVAIFKVLKIKDAISYDQHVKIYDGLPTKEKLKILFSDTISELKKKKINKIKQKETTKLLKNNIKFDEKIYNTIKKLHNSKIRICIASNAVESTVKICIAKLKLNKFIEFYISNDDLNNPKPHPEIYLRCFLKLGVLPKECVIVEDSYYGIKAAHESGGNIHQVINKNELNYKDIKNFINLLNKRSINKNIMWKDNKMNVLIPMAGEGSRFATAGYTFPKPLIEINQKPMIQVVIENLGIDANFIFLVRKEHDKKYNISSLLKTLKPNCKIILVDSLTEGAACTTLLAKKFINNDQSLIISNSDQFIEWDSSKTLYEFKSKKIDGGILVFNSIHPKWSYVKSNNDNEVTEVAEKKVISNKATVGIYYWNKGSDYVKFAEQMIKKNIRVNNEFYVCPVFNEAVKEKKTIKISKIKKMWGLGTPEDLDFFIKKYRGNI